ncbi:MAG: hypothetical protein ACLVJH_19410 [Faecalibacterium prausnitzii]
MTCYGDAVLLSAESARKMLCPWKSCLRCWKQPLERGRSGASPPGRAVRRAVCCAVRRAAGVGLASEDAPERWCLGRCTGRTGAARKNAADELPELPELLR